MQNYWFFFPLVLLHSCRYKKIYYSRKEFEWNYYHLSENFTFYLNKISCHLMIFWWRLESERTRGKKNHKSYAPDFSQIDKEISKLGLFDLFDFQTFLYSLRIDRILWLAQDDTYVSNNIMSKKKFTFSKKKSQKLDFRKLKVSFLDLCSKSLL